MRGESTTLTTEDCRKRCWDKIIGSPGESNQVSIRSGNETLREKTSDAENQTITTSNKQITKQSVTNQTDNKKIRHQTYR